MRIPSPRHAAYAIAAALIVVLAWAGPLDSKARTYVQTGLERALVTFGTARAANAVISMIQETTVNATPVGVGLTVSPGQALDPLNDLIEQFSFLMLAASVSLGMQYLMIAVSSHAAVSAMVTVALLAWLGFLWRSRASPRWLARIVVLALFVRFAVPVAAFASEAVFELTMASEYREAQSLVDAQAKDVIAAAPAEPAEAKSGLWERAQRWLAEKRENVQAKAGDVAGRLERSVRHIVKLMAVFAIQTVVLPILFLWIAYRLFSALFSPAPPRRP